MPVNWDIPYTISTPQGQLVLNQATESAFSSDEDRFVYLLRHEQCKASPGPLRFTPQPIPQASGSILPPSLRNGYLWKLTMGLWVQDSDMPDGRAPACNEDLELMWADLTLKLHSLENPSDADLFGSNARVGWTPPGFPARLLLRTRVVELPDPTHEQNLCVVTVALQSEFDYEIDAAEITATIESDDSAILTNGGTHEMYPVYRVNGPFTAFTIRDVELDETIDYDGGLPGATSVIAGHYIEIDTFRNVAYLDGAGANKKSGINITTSDFFPLAVGSQEIEFGADDPSATLEVLYQSAWA